jgi:hypothetical protein
MRKPMMIYREKDPNLYVVATRSNDFMGRLITWFSGKGSGLEEFDHIVFVYRGNEYHMTYPRAEKRPARYRDDNVIFQVTGNIHEALGKIQTIVRREDRYGVAQLISKAFTTLFGLNPIKARRDCIEFVLECLLPEKIEKIDNYTVGQGVHLLKSLGVMHEIARYKKD